MYKILTFQNKYFTKIFSPSTRPICMPDIDIEFLKHAKEEMSHELLYSNEHLAVATSSRVISQSKNLKTNADG